jgi:riboflavin synthase
MGGENVFTGLVKCLGIVKDAAPFGNGRRFRINIDALAPTSRIGQSIAVNGVCLTITSLRGDEAAFDAVSETVARTNLGKLKAGDKVNLEPALKVGDVLDGHIVLGHVDVLAPVLKIDSASADNRKLTIALPASIRHLVAEKGSVAVDGISLTVAEAGKDWFTIAVIPHTWDNSGLSCLAVGGEVNVEADVMARYAARLMQFPQAEVEAEAGGGGVTMDALRRNGFV